MQAWLEWLKGLHSAEGIAQLLSQGGLAVIVGIVFAETGLLVGFFLPGDSLLITAGVLANPLNPNHVAALEILTLNVVLVLAAITGDQVGYRLGRRTGDAIWKRKDGRLYKRKHLDAAHEFYVKYGALSVVAARYVPIVRTFVPFVAGVARMEPRKFVFWNVLGGLLWVTSLLWVGYFLGQTPLANRLDKIIVIVIFVSFLPMIFGVAKGMLRGRAAAPKAKARARA
jgi:membrane-associated protein